MDYTVDETFSYDAIKAIFEQCQPHDFLCCRDEVSFALAKQVIQHEKITSVTVQLLDDAGYAVRQITSQERKPDAATAELNDRQLVVVKALERVLAHCKDEGVRLVGYSDGLVAVSSDVPTAELACASAIEVDAKGVYIAADALTQPKE